MASSDKKSNLGKWMYGCALTLAAVAAMVVIFLVAAYWWVSVPGPQVDTEWFIGAETTGIFHLDQAFEDEGVLEFLTATVLAAQELQSEVVDGQHPMLGNIQQFFSPDAEDIRRDLENRGPRQVTIILELVEGDSEAAPAAILNLNRFPRLFALGARFFANFADNVREYQGYDLIPLDEGVITFIDSTMVWSADYRTIEQILDRLQAAPTEARAIHPPGEGFADPRWDLFGRIENRAEILSRWLERWEEPMRERIPGLEQISPELLASLQALDIGLDLQTEERAVCSLQLRSDSGRSAAWATLLETRLSEVATFGESMIESYRVNDRGGSLVEMELVLKDFHDSLFATVREAILAGRLEELPELERSPE